MGASAGHSGDIACSPLLLRKAAESVNLIMTRLQNAIKRKHPVQLDTGRTHFHSTTSLAVTAIISAAAGTALHRFMSNAIGSQPVTSHVDSHFFSPQQHHDPEGQRHDRILLEKQDTNMSSSGANDVSAAQRMISATWGSVLTTALGRLSGSGSLAVY
jgi:hypothetical protein